MGFVRFGPLTKVLHGAVDLTSYFREASVPMETDVEDATTCGKTAKVYKPTLSDGTATLAGLWDGAVSAVDERLASMLGADASLLTVAWDGLTAGNRVALLDAIETTYEVSAGVGGLVEVSAEFQANEGARSGVALASLAARNVTANGTTVDQTAATTAGGFGVLHATAGAGSANVKVQHSSDASTWVDLVQFDLLTAPSSQRKSVAGTVNRYVRAQWTFGTGPITFAVSFARL